MSRSIQISRHFRGPDVEDWWMAVMYAEGQENRVLCGDSDKDRVMRRANTWSAEEGVPISPEVLSVNEYVPPDAPAKLAKYEALLREAADYMMQQCGEVDSEDCRACFTLGNPCPVRRIREAIGG